MSDDGTRNGIGSLVSKDFLLYVAKCVAGTALCYSLYAAFPRYPLYWSIVSTLLVLDPDYAESMRLAVDRMKANVYGAAIGLVALLAGPPTLLSTCVAVVLTIVACGLLRLGKATRSALAALVIVMLSSTASWVTALERMACVIVGCVVAIALTAIASLPSRLAKPRAEGSRPGEPRRRVPRRGRRGHIP